MKFLLLRTLDLVGGLCALFGALLVGWNAIAVYYLTTGRVVPDPEQPPLAVVVPLLVFGFVLLFGGWGLRRWLRKNLRM